MNLKLNQKMSLQLSNNNNEKSELIDPENLIKEGINIIYQSFNTNMENYQEQIEELKNIINDLNKKLEILKEEIEMIQRENQYYKTQNKKLNSEVENLNKVVNNIKGKLINFDFNINTKQIIENMSQNMGHKFKNHMKNRNSFFNNMKTAVEVDNSMINNSNYKSKNYYREQMIKNKEPSRNSRTIRYDLGNSDFNDIIYDSEINSINNEDILSEIYPCENQLNYYNNKNSRQLQTLHSELNIRNKQRSNPKSYNDENSKNNYYQNNIRNSEYSSINKKNINFNSYKNINTYRRKNKIRNDSLNNMTIKKEKINKNIKYLIRNNKEEKKENKKINSESKLEFPDNNDYDIQICKTFQNNKNGYKNNNIYDNNFINELKMKEISFFIEKCKSFLDKESFEIIYQLYKTYRDKIIKDKDIIKQIKFYLKLNDILLNLFNNIIL